MKIILSLNLTNQNMLLKDKTEEAIKLLKSIINESKNYIAYTKLAKFMKINNDNEK